MNEKDDELEMLSRYITEYVINDLRGETRQ